MTRSLLAAVCAGLLLASCGGGSGDDNEDSAAGQDNTTADGAVFGSGAPLEIEAYDLYFEPKDASVPPGVVDVTYVNKGEIYHTLKIDHLKGLDLSVTTKGDTDKGAVDLKPGKYLFFCDLPGHRQAGMETVVMVGGPPPKP